MASFVLKNIGKCYGGNLQAVKNFNLEIRDGEFIILVGPSGCGKSTTLRMIAGLEEITQGTLLIDGERANDKPAGERDIAMVFQNYALYPSMTVYENMAFGLRMRKLPEEEIHQRVQEAACSLGLEALLNRKPKALSGGEQQRTAMGRAMVRHPKLFLMDEPLSNLDARLRVKIRQEIAELHRRLGASILYVTHDQTEAMTLGTRIVVMKDGLVQQIDTPERLYQKPQNLFVAGFIGAPQMNFFTGTLRRQGTEYRFLGDSICFTLPANPSLAPYAGTEVIAGVRPEDVAVKGQQPCRASGSFTRSPVLRREYLGAEAYYYIRLDETPVVIRAREGEEVDQNWLEWGICSDRVHLFHRATGERIGG